MFDESAQVAASVPTARRVPHGAHGVGYYYMTSTNDRVKLVLPRDYEQGFEIFYTLAVTLWFD